MNDTPTPDELVDVTLLKIDVWGVYHVRPPEAGGWPHSKAVGLLPELIARYEAARDEWNAVQDVLQSVWLG